MQTSLDENIIQVTKFLCSNKMAT